MGIKFIMLGIVIALFLAGCSDEEIIIIREGSEPGLSEVKQDYKEDFKEDYKEDYRYPFIYNMHEHLEIIAADNMIAGMNKANIGKIVVLGSPAATFYKSTKKGFYDYDKNNEEILELAKNNKDIVPFCTIWPLDEEKLLKFKVCINKGAKGLKLYSGNTLLFYDSRLNLSDMYPVYSYLEENDLPIIFHVNPGKFTIQDEFEAVLRDFPGLRIICPHFCLSSIASDRLEYLMDNYPNLYTDISFGLYAKDGLKRISRNVTKFKALIEKYQDRIFFGTDMIVTSVSYKTSDWIYNLTMCYRNMLEKDSYHCSVGNSIDLELNGLKLDESVLYKIYYGNARKFLGG